MERSITQTTFLKPPSEQLLRVAGYARVSSGKDAMLHSMAAQVSHYSDFIQKHRGWSYVGVYADEAKTGTKDARDEFQRMPGQLPRRENRFDYHKVDFTLCAEHGHLIGNGAGAEGTRHRRVV